jgi:hypothetical protein
LAKDIFMKEWVDHNTSIFKKLYPSVSEIDIRKFLKNKIDSKIVNQKAAIHNNYENKIINVDLLKVIDWVDNGKPLIAGFGCFYKDQEHERNPAAKMVENFMITRKKYKNKMYEYSEDSYEYAMYDLFQNIEKISCNSYYGANGAKTSTFFNIYNASAITATGQSMISTTTLAFEAFMANNVKFMNLDEALFYLENIVKDNKKYSQVTFLPKTSINKVLNRLKEMFFEYDESYELILYKYLSDLTQNDLNRIYFKNNIYEFSYLPKIRKFLNSIVNKVNEFKNPNQIPKEIKDDLDTLWTYYNEYVFYNHFYFDRIDRLKNNTRKIVTVIDTDSNLLNLDPWFEFMKRFIIYGDNRLMNREYDNLRFISINIISNMITRMITAVMLKYGKYSNVTKKYRPRLNMKNEYLFTRLVLSNTKKRYIASMRLREGHEIYPEKIEIKGILKCPA